MTTEPALGRVGIWSAALRRGDRARAIEAAGELEALGYGALWFPGGGAGVAGGGGGAFELASQLLHATRGVAVVTAIANVWWYDPADVGQSHEMLSRAHPDRFVLGLGVGHEADVDPTRRDIRGGSIGVMSRYLDELDAQMHPVPQAERVIAALGPRMLSLARTRTAGAHTYLVPVTHTRGARAHLGADRLLVPEQAVVLDERASATRTIARTHVSHYLHMPNYSANLRRLGFVDADLSNGGSDRLVDALVATGSPQAIAARVREHLDAGADHVAVQVLTEDRRAFPMEQWRALAPALLELT